MHAGFVGHGMLDAACPGQVFTSPTPDQMVAAAEAVDGGAGLLLIVKNYAGDVMNFEMAGEMLSADVATVLINDDVAVEDSTYTTGRRGVAGTVLVEKIVGAAAEAGADLAACKALGDRVNEATGSMGVALTSCTVPAAGSPTFAIGEDEMEMGVGIHGEPGRRRVGARERQCDRRRADRRDLRRPRSRRRRARAAAGQRLRRHAADGAVPDVPRRGCSAAATAASQVVRSLVGNYTTSLEMAGCSLTLTRLDDEMISLWDAPVHTAGPALGPVDRNGSDAMQYRREIDGLRAVAVIPVVLFHAGFGIFGGGYVGVDVFFVISGYLITSILIGELERGEFSIVRFYERRARRILPALFFVMLVCIPFAWIWMAPSQIEDFGRSLVAVSLFASNILFWRESDYFAPAAEEKPLLHTWSLAVEEQYYMFFPLLLLLAWRFGRWRVFYLIAAIAAASLLLCEWGWREAPVANFYLAPTRAWELLAGSLCAFLQFGKEQKRDDLLAALGLGLIVFAIFVFDAATPFPSLYALAPVGGTVLIILFAANGTWTARLLSTGHWSASG